MKATIKTWNDNEWQDAYTITTDPVSVTDSEGNLLNDDELAEWLETQRVVPVDGERVTAKDNLEKWLEVNAKSSFTRVRFVLDK